MDNLVTDINASMSLLTLWVGFPPEQISLVTDDNTWAVHWHNTDKECVFVGRAGDYETVFEYLKQWHDVLLKTVIRLRERYPRE